MKTVNNIYRMDGIGKVFRFTLSMMFKNKGYLISYIMMIAMMAFMGPISMLSSGAAEKAVKETDSINVETKADTIFFFNETDIDIDIKSVLEDTAFSDVEIAVSDEIPALTASQIAVRIYGEEKGGSYYHIESIISDDSDIAEIQLDSLSSEIYKAFENRKIEVSGVSESTVSIIQSNLNKAKVLSQEDYLSKDENKMPASQIIVYSTAYSIILMILINLTVSYVITTVMEEKTSKLVENLLISVRPLALIMGKIFAMMVYVLSMLLFGGIGSIISNSVASYFLKSEAAAEVSEHMNFASILGLSFWKILILLLSLVLTYLMFSILAGILGSSCNKTEEVGPVIMLITMISMAGYVAGMGLPNFELPVLDKIFSVIPFVSSYVGPIYFVCGRIPFYIYLTGLVLQVLFIILLFRLCAKVYRKLIVNDSKKLKLIEIIKLAGTEA